MTKKILKIVVGAVVALILLVVVLDYFNLIPVNFLPRLEGNKYQAVFLTNGQVYFGKLYRQNGGYPVLREVYYLQVTQPPQLLQEGAAPQTNINIIKLGGELHGPEDEMRINRQNILFIEDLKADSRVVQAIEQLKSAGK
jgi:hypothetical protein